MIYVQQFLIALISTIVIETTTLFFLIIFFFKKFEIQNKQILFTGVIASSITLPFLWFLLPNLLPSDYYILIGELIVVIAEAIIFKKLLKLDIKNSVLLSIICNVLSYTIGLLII